MSHLLKDIDSFHPVDPLDTEPATDPKAIAAYCAHVRAFAAGKIGEFDRDILEAADRLPGHWKGDTARLARRLQCVKDLVEADELDATANKIVVPPKPNPRAQPLSDFETIGQLEFALAGIAPGVVDVSQHPEAERRDGMRLDASGMRQRAHTDLRDTSNREALDEIDRLNREASETVAGVAQERADCENAERRIAGLKDRLFDGTLDGAQQRAATADLARRQRDFPPRRIRKAARAYAAAEKNAGKLKAKRLKLIDGLAKPENMAWAE